MTISADCWRIMSENTNVHRTHMQQIQSLLHTLKCEVNKDKIEQYIRTNLSILENNVLFRKGRADRPFHQRLMENELKMIQFLKSNMYDTNSISHMLADADYAIIVEARQRFFPIKQEPGIVQPVPSQQIPIDEDPYRTESDSDLSDVSSNSLSDVSSNA